jgi:hypothetical protein
MLVGQGDKLCSSSGHNDYDALSTQSTGTDTDGTNRVPQTHSAILSHGGYWLNEAADPAANWAGGWDSLRRAPVLIG